MEEAKLYKIAENLKNKKGAFVKLVFERKMEPSARFREKSIVKHVELTCRTGVRYSNMSAVIEARAEAQPNAYVKTWEWVPGYERFIKRNLKSGQLLFTFETATNDHKKVSYTIDGVPASEDEVRAITPAKPWKDPRSTDTFDVKFENIITIGGEN